MRKSLIWGVAVAVVILGLSVAMAGDKSHPSTQKFNLADLANGESRTFGEGEQAITATRYGDDIEVTYQGKDGENKKQTLHCTVGKDNCYAMTLSGEGKGHVVVLSKTGTVVADGGKELTKIVLADGSGESKSLMVFASDGDDADSKSVVVSGGPGMSWVVEIHEEGTTLLQCPKGDATLTLKKGEENSGPYLCPKHNLKMEAVKTPVVIKKVEVQKKGDAGSDSRGNEY
jgi:hypothetical protein